MRTLTNARSYKGTKTDSDHRLLVCRMNIDKYMIYSKKKEENNHKIDIELLRVDENTRMKYQDELSTEIDKLKEKRYWNDISKCITKTAEKVMGLKKTRVNQKTTDKMIAQMSEEQKQLRMKISNTDDLGKMKAMKSERNQILHKIQKRIIELRDKEIDNKIKEIDSYKDDTKMFKAVEHLTKDKQKTLYIQDEEGKHITNKQKMYDTIREHFEKHFNDPNVNIEVSPKYNTTIQRNYLYNRNRYELCIRYYQ